MSARHNGEGEGIVALVRETADGLGDLIADHVKLARLELAADMKSYGRQVAAMAVAGVVMTIGYAFAWITAALALVRWLGPPLAFGSVAALHLLGGAVGMAVAARRMRRVHPLGETVSEVRRSVGVVTAPAPARPGLRPPA